jgi:hypothetical protein
MTRRSRKMATLATAAALAAGLTGTAGASDYCIGAIYGGFICEVLYPMRQTVTGEVGVCWLR